jgi:hypothetical protein
MVRLKEADQALAGPCSVEVATKVLMLRLLLELTRARTPSGVLLLLPPLPALALTVALTLRLRLMLVLVLVAAATSAAMMTMRCLAGGGSGGDGGGDGDTDDNEEDLDDFGGGADDDDSDNDTVITVATAATAATAHAPSTLAVKMVRIQSCATYDYTAFASLTNVARYIIQQENVLAAAAAAAETATTAPAARLQPRRDTWAPFAVVDAKVWTVLQPAVLALARPLIHLIRTSPEVAHAAASTRALVRWQCWWCLWWCRSRWCSLPPFLPPSLSLCLLPSPPTLPFSLTPLPFSLTPSPLGACLPPTPFSLPRSLALALLLTRGFCVGGSWPAHLTAVQQALGATPLTACRELLYHDVDVYAGAGDDGAFHRHGGATKYRKMFSDDCEYEINTVTCDDPRATDPLEGNDLNMTGVVIDCHGANA